MFKNLTGADKRTALLVDAISEIVGMLEKARRMVSSSCSSGLADADARAQMEKDDHDINAGERQVRRMILQHLTLNPDQDLSTSLAVISVVHDVERLGDYAKNLAELNQWGSLWAGEDDCAYICREIADNIDPMFARTLEALREDDAELARQVMRKHEEIKKRTDAIVSGVIERAGEGREAVLYTLASRFLRRISAHLSNVASSVVNPLDRVGGKEVQ